MPSVLCTLKTHMFLRPPLRCLGLKKNIAKGAMERGGQKPNEGQHHHHQGQHQHHPVKFLQSCSRVVTKQGIRRTMLRRRLLTWRMRNSKRFRSLFCHLTAYSTDSFLFWRQEIKIWQRHFSFWYRNESILVVLRIWCRKMQIFCLRVTHIMSAGLGKVCGKEGVNKSIFKIDCNWTCQNWNWPWSGLWEGGDQGGGWLGAGCHQGKQEDCYHPCDRWRRNQRHHYPR